MKGHWAVLPILIVALVWLGVEESADTGTHVTGVRRTQAGGLGIQGAIRVSDPSVNHLPDCCDNPLEFVRPRVMLRYGDTNQVLLETGWEERSDYSDDQLVITRHGDPFDAFDEIRYNQYDLVEGQYYTWKVIECQNGVAVCAYIYWGGSWVQIDSDAASDTGYRERADVWVESNQSDPHPGTGSGAIHFNSLQLKTSSGTWYTWTDDRFPTSQSFAADPYDVCGLDPFNIFYVARTC